MPKPLALTAPKPKSRNAVGWIERVSGGGSQPSRNDLKPQLTRVTAIRRAQDRLSQRRIPRISEQRRCTLHRLVLITLATIPFSRSQLCLLLLLLMQAVHGVEDTILSQTFGASLRELRVGFARGPKGGNLVLGRGFRAEGFGERHGSARASGKSVSELR